jgi:hypothetical protein
LPTPIRIPDPLTDPQSLQREVNQAFEAFRESLRHMLEAAARERVETVVSQFSQDGGVFQLTDVEVDVIIRDLTLVAGTDERTPPRTISRRKLTQPKPRTTRPSRAGRAGKAARSRTGGPVRTALLDAFAITGGAIQTYELQRALADRGVDTTVNNLHQQLRRLVQAGEIERAGRGVYRRARGATAGPDRARSR